MPPASAKQAAFAFDAQPAVAHSPARAPTSPVATSGPQSAGSEPADDSEARRAPRSRSKSECTGDPCLYCDMPLLSAHEHDHFPIPYRHGGTQTFCVCFNCHDLKDRVAFGKLSLDFGLKALFELWPKLTVKQRIILAKFTTCMTDVLARRGQPVAYEDDDDKERTYDA